MLPYTFTIAGSPSFECLCWMSPILDSLGQMILFIYLFIYLGYWINNNFRLQEVCSHKMSYFSQVLPLLTPGPSKYKDLFYWKWKQWDITQSKKIVRCPKNDTAIFNVLGESPFIFHSFIQQIFISSYYVLNVVPGAIWMLLPLYITICVH